MSFQFLIVDDSETVRAVIRKTLTLSGLPVGEVFDAPNGEEGLKVLGSRWVDIVFADINMPVMNGFEMIEKMKESEMLRAIPIVVVSTEGSSTRIEQLKEKGVNGYLRKPFTPEGLRNIVEELLGKTHDDHVAKNA